MNKFYDGISKIVRKDDCKDYYNTLKVLRCLNARKKIKGEAAARSARRRYDKRQIVLDKSRAIRYDIASGFQSLVWLNGRASHS